MKMRLLTFLALSCISITHAGELILEGVFDGKSIFISNPFLTSDSFCVSSICVNGVYLTDQTLSSAFEINLNKMGLKSGEPYRIVITHHDGCSPTVLSDIFYSPKK